MSRVSLNSSTSLLANFSALSLAENQSIFSSQLDSSITHFVHEATNLRTLIPMVFGSGAYQLGRASAMTLLGASNPARFISLTFGLGVEVSVFEETHYRLRDSVTDIPRPSLFSGQWFHDALNFGLLKTAGHFFSAQNIIISHFAQDSAIVLGNRFSQTLGLSSPHSQNLFQEFLEASLQNIQLGLGMSWAYRLMPFVSRFEQILARSQHSLQSRSVLLEGSTSMSRFLPLLGVLGLMGCESGRSFQGIEWVLALGVIGVFSKPEVRSETVLPEGLHQILNEIRNVHDLYSLNSHALSNCTDEVLEQFGRELVEFFTSGTIPQQEAAGAYLYYLSDRFSQNFKQRFIEEVLDKRQSFGRASPMHRLLIENYLSNMSSAQAETLLRNWVIHFPDFIFSLNLISQEEISIGAHGIKVFTDSVRYNALETLFRTVPQGEVKEDLLHAFVQSFELDKLRSNVSFNRSSSMRRIVEFIDLRLPLDL
ncbi:MAG: hypothetical protein JNK65_09345, partial [Deltaproteobacteria bacterium]|nr:hypothetical protein [Deltaproteobacteria bacterium]